MRDDDTPPAGTGTGLSASYFKSLDLTGTPLATRCDARLLFDWNDKPQRIPIRLELVHKRAYGANFRLQWSSPSQWEEVVPTSRLYPEE